MFRLVPLPEHQNSAATLYGNASLIIFCFCVNKTFVQKLREAFIKKKKCNIFYTRVWPPPPIFRKV